MPLANLLDAVGGALRPKGFCVQELADQGAGHPDFGLYSTRQVQRGKPKTGQKPERGVVEVSTATVVRFADALDSRIYVMTIGRSTAGINKTEAAGAARVQIRSIDTLRRVLPTRLTSYREFRGWICQETLLYRSSVTFDVRQRDHEHESIKVPRLLYRRMLDTLAYAA